jgi:hypothetical protein
MELPNRFWPPRVAPFCDEPARTLPKVQYTVLSTGSMAGWIQGVAPPFR